MSLQMGLQLVCCSHDFVMTLIAITVILTTVFDCSLTRALKVNARLSSIGCNIS